MQAKDIEEAINLVLKGMEVVGPAANSYWLLTEMAPNHFKGFMGFVTNTNPTPSTQGAPFLANPSNQGNRG
jgi:hypothetical protein